jgi:hypothetical protein
MNDAGDTWHLVIGQLLRGYLENEQGVPASSRRASKVLALQFLGAPASSRRASKMLALQF